MRTAQLALLCAACVLSCELRAEESLEDFPFAARVRVSRASVRGGPGRQHYVCAVLPRGTTVEVFQSQEGWLAIKPPESCFSLIAANKVRMTEDEGLGEVVRPQAISWIGPERPQAGDHVWQVQLDEGEPVEVLGEESFSPVTGGQARKYYRIAPPAGEFRWVRESDLEIDPRWNLIEASADQVDDSETASRIAKLKVGAPTAGYQSPSFTDTSSPPTAEVTPVAHFVTPNRGSPNSKIPESASGKEKTNPNSRWRPSKVSPRAFDDATVESLAVELSAMVAGEAPNWELEPLRVAAERLVGASSSNLERAKAKRLVERIREFETIQQGHLRMASQEPKPAQTKTTTAMNKDREPASASRSSPAVTSSQPEPKDQPEDASQYDGIGTLAPVYSKTQAPAPRSVANLWGLWGRANGPIEQSTAPPYALLDKDKNIIQFVSPSPGLNLHRYKDKEVGIIGNERYDASLRRPLLTAERVIELDRHRR